MFQAVKFEGDVIYIQDTFDGSIDAVPSVLVMLALQYMTPVGNLWLNEDGSLGCNSSIFVPSNEGIEFEDDEDESEDDYVEYLGDEEDDEDDEGYVVDEDEESDDDYVIEEEEYEDDEDGYYEEEYIEEEEEFVGWEEEDDEYGSTVAKLYSYLTPEQITVLKRYYLWYSQRIFSEGQKDPTLGMKSKAALARKKANLSTLRNTGGLWHYAGFIDTGYKGGGYCTLGHSLRYMHIAWDVTESDIETAFFGEKYDNNIEDALDSDSCIIFGIKCISDFFEVNKECVLALQRAQREALKDMAMLNEFYEAGNQEEVYNSFSILDEVMEAVKLHDVSATLFNPDGETFLPTSVLQFYMQFRSVKMVPPKSLIQEIRDKLIGWTTHKFVGSLGERYIDQNVVKLVKLLDNNAKEDILKHLLSFNFTSSYYYSIQDLISAYMWTYFVYEICGWYKYNTETSKDEGGRSKPVKQVYNTIYDSIKVYLWTDLDYSVGSLNKIIKLFNLACTYVSRDDNFRSHGMDVGEDGFYYVTDIMHIDNAIISRFSSEKNVPMTDDINELEKYHVGRWSSCRLFKGKTLDESIAELETLINRMNSYIPEFKTWELDYVTKRVEERNEQIRERIRQEEIERENRELLRKQREEENRIMREAAEARAKLSNAESTSLKKSSELNFTEMIDILKDADLDDLDKFDFQRQVLATVAKTGKCTNKQGYFIRVLYDAYRQKQLGEEVVAAERAKLSDNPELEEAVKWVLEHKDEDIGLEEKTIRICQSVSTYGTISDRQMKYVEEARSAYLEHTSGNV